jgi:hypothetical protein
MTREHFFRFPQTNHSKARLIQASTTENQHPSQMDNLNGRESSHDIPSPMLRAIAKPQINISLTQGSETPQIKI